MLCHTGDLDCSNKGWKAVAQHMQNETHKRISNALKNNSQFSFSIPTATATSSTSSSNMIQLVNPNLCHSMIKYYKLKFYGPSSPFKMHLVTEPLMTSMNYFVQCFQIPKSLKNFRFGIQKCLMLFHMVLDHIFVSN